MATERKKVLVTDSIASEAVDLLHQGSEVDVRTNLSPTELIAAIGDYQALVVRSQTKVTGEVIEAGTRLEVIARAGVGVDNIDVDAATRRGILVINSPEGNIVSAAEHTMAMLLSLVRQIPRANNELRAGVWNRSLKGVEVRNKVLGIVGFGRVGTSVAEMARGFHIKVVAYDPLVTQSAADRLGVQMVDFKSLLAASDFVTVHVPLNQATRGLIGKEQLAQMKRGSIIVNCARGGIVDEAALLESLNAGHLAGAAIDVFEKEPAVGNRLTVCDKTVVTPHLAASTVEAEINAGKDVAEQVVAVLRGNPARTPVNAPAVSPDGMMALTDYITAATTLGMIATQLMEGQAKSITIYYQGDIAVKTTTPLKAAILSGLLENVTDERVNMVNMDIVAASRGLRVSEVKHETCENYSNMLTVEIQSSSGKTTVAVSSLRERMYLVRVNDFWFEIEPTGSYMLFTEHKDRPGQIGAVGTVMGNAGVNISQMQVSRGLERGGKAMMVLCVDDHLTDDVRQRLLSIQDMYRVHVVSLLRLRP
jgi:D-3-phosphoglycerate dehydrogenase / 2-oxoglutarate reductase